MLVCEAARMHLPLFPDGTQAVRDEEGKTLEHIKWMLDEIRVGNIRGEKAHRWLGYAQGALVWAGMATLEQVKEINYYA